MARKKSKKSKSNLIRKILISLAVLIVMLGGFALKELYQRVYQPNVILNQKSSVYFYIPTGSDYEFVVNSLYESGYIRNRNTLMWIAEKKNYHNNVKAGKYKLKNNMSNNALIDLLRSGEQDPIKLTFHNIRTKKDLVEIVGDKLEADQHEILHLLNDPATVSKYGFNSETILTMFIPNTYQFFWNTSAEGFIQRMAEEYKKFWNDDRKAKARKLKLTQSEVTILASIVQAEQNIRKDERPKVAGLYINRLRKKMRLESDPTIVYANGNYNVKRVLTVDRKIDSPYNTYKYRGLPPGPINIPDISAIDAVLNHENHEYIFMCAKEDFSGYHNFSKTYRQHQINARRYQQELNKRKIYR